MSCFGTSESSLAYVDAILFSDFVFYSYAASLYDVMCYDRTDLFGII